jgi:uncharacterized protein YcfJ
MKKLVTLASVAALSLPLLSAPQVSFAQAYRDYGRDDICQEQKHDNANKGTVIGAIAGAVIGSQVAGHGNKTAGALVGAGAGALVGRQIGKSTVNCKGYPDRYRRHSDNCRWVEERNRGRTHEFEVCQGRDGQWRPSGRG